MKKTASNLLLLTMAIQLSAWGTAYAAGPAFMHTGGRTTQPVGHYEFCQKRPQECNERTPKQAPVELTRKLWATSRQYQQFGQHQDQSRSQTSTNGAKKKSGPIPTPASATARIMRWRSVGN